MKAGRAAAPTRLDLQHFLPFRLNRLAAEFSAALHDDYGLRFGLDIPEWRVLATLGADSVPRSAATIVRCTRTHKSRISRAVAHLTAQGYLQREPGSVNRREAPLRLTAQGRAVYAALVPRMLAREGQLLAGLTPHDRRALADLLTKLEGACGIDGDGEESRRSAAS